MNCSPAGKNIAFIAFHPDAPISTWSRDDNQIIKWSPDGDYLGVASTFNVSASSTKGKAEEPASPVYITEFQWSPMAPGKGQSSAESYVVGATDGMNPYRYTTEISKVYRKTLFLLESREGRKGRRGPLWRSIESQMELRGFCHSLWYAFDFGRMHNLESYI